MNRSAVCRRLILALAAAFVISSWVTCLATLHLARGNPADRPPVTSPVVIFFGTWGGTVLAGELAALAAAALYWRWAERTVSDRSPRRASSGYNGRDAAPADAPRRRAARSGRY